MRRAIAAVTLIGVLILAYLSLSSLQQAQGAGSLTLPNTSETPGEAVRRGVCGPGSVPIRFHVYEVYERQTREDSNAEKYATVVYRAQCPPSARYPKGDEFASFALVRWSWLSWRDIGANFGHRYTQDEFRHRAGDVASYTIGSGNDLAVGQYALVTGRLLTQREVVAVEASFDNGETIREQVNGSVYLLFSPASTTACELRVLGANRVLQRTVLTDGGKCTGKS